MELHRGATDQIDAASDAIDLEVYDFVQLLRIDVMDEPLRIVFKLAVERHLDDPEVTSRPPEMFLDDAAGKPGFVLDEFQQFSVDREYLLDERLVARFEALFPCRIEQQQQNPHMFW